MAFYSGESPFWRFIVTDLGTQTLAMLDELASQRSVTYILNHPAEASGFVPSDAPQINLLHDDGYPVLNEGNRLLYGFRRLNRPPATNIWQCAFAGRIELLEDATRTNDGQSHYTAYDPWRYWNSVYFYGKTEGPGNVLSGDIKFQDMASETIIRSLLQWVLGLPVAAYNDEEFPQSVFPAAGFATNPPLYVNFRVGEGNDASVEVEPLDCFQPSGVIEGVFTIPQGTSLGEAITMVVQTGTCDVIMEPAWVPIDIPNADPDLDVVAAPGMLCVMDVVPKAGNDRFQAVFSWDQPGRNLVQVSNLFDGTGRSNRVQYFAGQGGAPVAPQIDAASQGVYGTYESQTFVSGVESPLAATAMEKVAWAELELRKQGKETVTISPVPQRGPRFGPDFTLGDRVKLHWTNRLRQAVDGVVRIYGIPVEISDNSLEKITQLMCVGDAYSAPAFSGSSTENPLDSQVAVTTARGAPTRGGVTVLGPRRF